MGQGCFGNKVVPKHTAAPGPAKVKLDSLPGHAPKISNQRSGRNREIG